MIIQIGTGADESIILWKYNDKEKWRCADIDELIHAYEATHITTNPTPCNDKPTHQTDKPTHQTHDKRTETHGVRSDVISRRDAIDAVLNQHDWNGTTFEAISHAVRDIELIPSVDRPKEKWVPVSDIRKLEDILLMKINSFEGTRNIVEKGMLEVWKEVTEYIDGMLGEDGDKHE